MEKIRFKIPSKISKKQISILMIAAKRAQKLGAFGDEFGISMDIEAGMVAYGIDLEVLATFDDFNLMHDVSGIQRRINRQEMYFNDDLFIPRSARHRKD